MNSVKKYYMDTVGRIKLEYSYGDNLEIVIDGSGYSDGEAIQTAIKVLLSVLWRNESTIVAVEAIPDEIKEAVAGFWLDKANEEIAKG